MNNLNVKVSKVISKDNYYTVVFIEEVNDGIGVNTKYYNRNYSKVSEDIVGKEIAFSMEEYKVRVSEFISNGEETKGILMKRNWIMTNAEFQRQEEKAKREQEIENV